MPALSMGSLRGRVVRQVYQFGCRFLPRWCRPAPAGPLVLLYHSVEERYDVWTNKLGHNITPGRFAEHVRLLSEYFRVVPFSRICRSDAAPDEVAITFDDGSASIKDTVLPIIEKYCCPIKIYFTTGNMSGSNWLNKVCYLLNTLSTQEQAALRAAATGAAARHARKVVVHDFVHAFDPQRTPAVIEDYFRKACRGDVRRLYLTEEEARTLAGHPLIEIGSHTRHHYPLPRLGPELLHVEVVTNHHALNVLLDGRVRGFALPFGFRAHLTADVAEAVGEVDDMLVSAYGGRLDWQPCHGLLEVKRVSVGGSLGALWYRLNHPNPCLPLSG
jgi:peptidoglycan/xylan/chitin deacetylase (PgdA/CDA1 family)